MDAAELIRAARGASGLTLRALAERAGTSHSTLAAYESGRTIPTVTTLDRVLRAAGFDADVSLTRRAGGSPSERHARGLELIEVLELADMFPARHEQGNTFPRFDRVS